MRFISCIALGYLLVSCVPCPPMSEGEAEAEGMMEGVIEGFFEGAIEGAPSGECTGDCGFSIVNTYPHDTAAFTQGLVFNGGVLYESTGTTCCSQLRRVDLETGMAQAAIDVPEDFCQTALPVCNGATLSCERAKDLFAEGMTIFEDRIIQLTWTSCVGFVYDRASFAYQHTFNYAHEGWGITHDGARLIVSDGSSKLRFYDPYAFLEVGSVEVKENGRPVTRLNELEYVEGYVLANVWQTNTIVKINPGDGNVVARIDLTGILPASERTPKTDVLNGIAYDAAAKRLFVTGKYWPKLYEIAIVPKP